MLDAGGSGAAIAEADLRPRPARAGSRAARPATEGDLLICKRTRPVLVLKERESGPSPRYAGTSGSTSLDPLRLAPEATGFRLSGASGKMRAIMAAFDWEAADDDQGPYAQRRGAGRADADGAVATLCAGRVKRAQLVLLAAEGREAAEIGAGLRLHAKTARLWLKRFNAHGLAGLEESERPAARRPTPPSRSARSSRRR